MIENESGYPLQDFEKDELYKKEASVNWCFQIALDTLNFYKNSNLISEFKTSDVIELAKMILLEKSNNKLIKQKSLNDVCDKLHEIEDVVYNFFIKKKKELGKDVFILSDVARYIRPFKALDLNKRKEVLQGLEERDRILIVPKSKRFRILDSEVEV